MERKVKILILGFVMLSGCLFTKLNVCAEAVATMYVGENKNISIYINPDTYDIADYSWNITGGSQIQITSSDAHNCSMMAYGTGTAYLHYYVKSTYTYYIYTDVQRKHKKYITNTDTQQFTWKLVAGQKEQVTFDATGGNVTPGQITVGYGEGFTYGELPTPTRQGYVFDGWYTQKDGGKRIESTSNVDILGNHTLYAHWTQVFNYTVVFDGNGSDGGNMASQQYEYGSSYQLPVNAYYKKGNHFVEWNTKSDGTGKSYTNYATVKNLTSTPGSNVTLYAIWSDENLASGSYYDISWVIDAEGKLVISGEGNMPKITEGTQWRKYLSSVSAVVIEEGITSISEWAFQGMKALTSVELAESVTRIDTYAFQRCYNLSQIDLKKVQSVGSHAFSECSLKEVYIPATLDSLSTASFGCSTLENIYVDEKNSTYLEIDGVLYNKDKTRLELYPAGHAVTDGIYVIPDGITTIGYCPFYDGNAGRLNTLVVPASVSSIGTQAFSGNTDIKNIYFKGEPPELTKTVMVQGAPAETWAFTGVKANFYYSSAYADKWTESVRSAYGQACIFTLPQITWKEYTLSNSIEDCNIVVNPTKKNVYDELEQKAEIVISDQEVPLVENVDYTLFYDNNIHAGEASVTISGLGNYAGTETTRTFRIEKAEQKVSYLLQDNVVLADKQIAIEDAKGYGTIRYASADESVAKVDENGVITGVNVGKTKIKIMAEGDTDHKEGIVQVDIVVQHNPDLSPIGLDIDKEKTQYYEGETITLDDLQVYVIYADHYIEVVSDYSTNIDELNTTQSGKQMLSVKWQRNGNNFEQTIPIEIIKKTTNPAKPGETTKPDETGTTEEATDHIVAKKAVYKVIDSQGKKKTVEYVGTLDKGTKIKIENTIKIKGVIYSVVSIGKNAFKGNKKIKKVTIGKNVTKIDQNAFYGCKSLKEIVIQTKQLKKNSIGKNAFKGIHKKAKFKVPKKQRKAYVKYLNKKTGFQKKTMKIKS